MKREERVECGGDEATKSGDCGHNLYKLLPSSDKLKRSYTASLTKLIKLVFAPLVDPRGDLPKRG